MKSLQEKGIGMIYITHRFPEIFEIANKVAILRDGMIVSQGDVCDYTYDMLMEGLLPKGYKQKEKIEVVQETARTKNIRSDRYNEPRIQKYIIHCTCG